MTKLFARKLFSSFHFLLIVVSYSSVFASSIPQSPGNLTIDWEQIEDDIKFKWAHQSRPLVPGPGLVLQYYAYYSDLLIEPAKAMGVEILNDEGQTDMMNADKPESLTDKPSIRQLAIVVGLEGKLPEEKNLPPILRKEHPVLNDIPPNTDARKQLESKVTDSIYRTLRFYEAHLEQITDGNLAFGLSILKGIDDKHGRLFQKSFPIEKWIQATCSGAFEKEIKFCHSLARQWKNRSGRKSNIGYWKSKSVLQKVLDETEDNVLMNIGIEPETLWGQLNGQCQAATVERCEIPWVCERTLLDLKPQSQYFLTHQLLQRLITETVDCPEIKYVTEENTYLNLCAKMNMEAKYLDILKVPSVYHDLFAEYVGFCSYMGYSNFLREDWLMEILSWQSKSDYGCFMGTSLLPFGIMSMDSVIKRNVTQNELAQNIKTTKERCLTHLTSVSLFAMSAYYDYLMDSQSN